MSAKQQNREPAKQYVSKTTKQCVNTTAKQQNRDFSQSVLQSVSTSVSQCFSQSVLQSVSASVSQYWIQSVLTSISQSVFLNKTPCGPFFFIRFVPDVGFGNGWFASSDWPANKWERGVIFDPFLSPRNIICFGTQQAVFSVTRNRFRNRKQLARKGVENSSEVVVFYRGHGGPTRNLAGEGFSKPPSPENREDPAILAWESGGLSLQSGTETARFRPIFGGWRCKISDRFYEFERIFELLIHQIEGFRHAISSY